MRTPVNYGPARRKTPERQVCGAHPGSVTLNANAKVAKLADAPDLGSGSRKAMGVRVSPFALLRSRLAAPAHRSASYGVQAARRWEPRSASIREGVSTDARSAKVDRSGP